MYLQTTRRPWVTMGVALTAASMLAAAPMPAVAPPRVNLPEIQLTGLVDDTATNLYMTVVTAAQLLPDTASIALLTPTQLINALVTSPGEAADILATLGAFPDNIGAFLSDSGSNGAMGLLQQLANAAAGPVAGPLAELASGGGPEDMLNAFFNGGTDLTSGPLSFLGDVLGPDSAGLFSDFPAGPLGFLALPKFLSVVLQGWNTGMGTNIPDTLFNDFGPFPGFLSSVIPGIPLGGVLSTTAGALDGLFGTSTLADGMDGVRDFVFGQVVGDPFAVDHGGLMGVLNDVGSQLQDLLSGVVTIDGLDQLGIELLNSSVALLSLLL